MKNRMQSLVAVTLCGLSLALFHLPAAHAASPQAVVSATAGNSPVGAVWVDTTQGTDLNTQAAAALDKQFAGSEWDMMDDGSFVISKGSTKLVVATWAANSDNSLIVFHGRSGKTTFDGMIQQNVADPTSGTAVLFANEVASDGSSARASQIITAVTISDATTSGGGF